MVDASFLNLDNEGSDPVWTGELDVLPTKGHGVLFGEGAYEVVSVEWVLPDSPEDPAHVLVGFQHAPELS